MWDSISIAENGERSLSLADLELRVISDAGVYRVHTSGAAVDERDHGWREIRAAVGQQFMINPATPDRPVVLRPQEPIAVAPGERTDLRVSLPLWVTLNLESRTVLDLPVRRLKQTWFGTPELGEPGYQWVFLPRHQEPPVRHRFSVPLAIFNASQSILWFERLFLRVVHLDLFLVRGVLESNPVTVAFKGTEQLSQISIEPAQNVVARGASLLTTRREPATADFIRRSFLWLREIAG